MRLRRYTKARAKLNRRADKIRREFLAEIGACEVCGHGYVPHLTTHEICNGHARKFAQSERCASLVVCSYCHRKFHERGQAGKLEALAWLYVRRFSDFDLERVHALRRDRWPELREVQAAVRKLEY